MARGPTHQIEFERVQVLLDAIGSCPALSLRDHRLLMLVGVALGEYRDVESGGDGEVLHAGSLCPWPLGLIPSDEALIAVRRPESLGRMFARLMPYGMSVIYAAPAFAAAFRDRFAARTRWFRLRGRTSAGE
jgi:hypothetical protein